MKNTKTHRLLSIGDGCQPMPPHPDLKAKITEDLDRLKNSVDINVLFNNLVIASGSNGLDDALIYPGNLFPLGTSIGPVRAARAMQPPLRNDINVLVVLVEFPDLQLAETADHYRDLFFSENVIPTGSVREFYKEVTNNKITIKGDIAGPFQLPLTLAQYAHNASGMGGASPNAQTMARDAAEAIKNSIDFSTYDNDNDGFVDAFIVIHAGPGAEVNNSKNNIWSHKWTLHGNPLQGSLSNTQIFAYLTVPDDCKLGVCAHELGHLLFGFPDLYDTTYRSEGIGNWCLMSGGSWNNNGLTPAHPSAWCKLKQGWVTVDIPKNNQDDVVITDVKTSFNIKKLWKNGLPGNEYFLIENRQPTNFDAYLPGGGLLVWHIDESIDENTNSSHYKVALLQADGNRDLETNRNRGDAGDPYPGSTANNTFDDNSSPDSLSYGGLSSGVAITGIKQNGSQVTCNIRVL